MADFFTSQSEVPSAPKGNRMDLFNMKPEFKKKRVTVVGMGRSGAAAAALLAREGAEVLVIDDRQKEVPASLQAASFSRGEGASLRFHLGAWREEDLLSAESVVLSPGVPLK